MERHEQIAQNLARLIEAAGTNPSQLAKSVGLNHTAARDIISGKSRNPTDRTLYLLARGLKVHITALTGEPPRDRFQHESTGLLVGEVEQLEYGRETADTVAHLAPHVEKPTLFIAVSDAPGFQMNTGSFLIVAGELRPSHPNQRVVISLPLPRSEARRCGIGHWFPPYIIPADHAFFGVAIDIARMGQVILEGTVVAEFRLDPGTTEAILNSSQELD